MGKKMLQVSSSYSLFISLQSVCEGRAGLDAHRKSMLQKVPNQNEWGKFEQASLTTKDIAFLSAKTKDEFAILRGKKEDVLFHGEHNSCCFVGVLVDMLESGKLKLYAHSHPERNPFPSKADRELLQRMRQKNSKIISWTTGREIIFSQSFFEP